MNNIDKFALKEMTENPIKLNFSDCKTLANVHLLLKIKFGLPEYYGENPDALWDCLRYLFYNEKRLWRYIILIAQKKL